MRKIIGMSAVFVISLLFPSSSPFAADKKPDKLYELYNSTSTPKHYKRVMKSIIQRREQRDKAVAKRALGVLKLGKVYALPNPAVGMTHPVIHIEAGLADKVEIKIYDPAGKLIEEAALTEPPVMIKGAYAYEYKVLLNNAPYGTCDYTVKAYKAGQQSVETSGRIMFIKTGNEWKAEHSK